MELTNPLRSQLSNMIRIHDDYYVARGNQMKNNGEFEWVRKRFLHSMLSFTLILINNITKVRYLKKGSQIFLYLLSI